MRLPFRIDRESRTGLAEQMVEGFKSAIARGVYRPDEALPGILELADAAGVSAKVPRTALARLAEEGWVKPRRGVGSLVLPCDAGPDVRGRILVYARGTGYSYYSVQLVSAMRSRFVKAGYPGGHARPEFAFCPQFRSDAREPQSVGDLPFLLCERNCD